MAIDFLEMNAKAIEEFRANDGECGPPFEGTPIVLVTMIGAKSGRELCSPLAYSTDGDDLVVIASMGGAPNNPNWYHNLVADPKVAITVGRDRLAVVARDAEGDERDRIWDELVERSPDYSQYRTRTDRVIPVVVLDRRNA